MHRMKTAFLFLAALATPQLTGCAMDDSTGASLRVCAFGELDEGYHAEDAPDEEYDVGGEGPEVQISEEPEAPREEEREDLEPPSRETESPDREDSGVPERDVP